MQTFNITRVIYVLFILLALWMFFDSHDQELFFNIILIATVTFNGIIGHQILAEIKSLKHNSTNKNNDKL